MPMTHARKGLILSGLIFPGLGQVVLKRYMRGVLLMTAVVAGMSFMIVETTRAALAAVMQIDVTNGISGMDQILHLAAQAAGHSHSSIYLFSTLLILFVWVLSAVDAYHIGRAMDRPVRQKGEA